MSINDWKIITSEERNKKKKGIKGCILGKSGIGKTSLLWTLDPEKTLFIDLEAGDLAVKGWTGDSISPRTWESCRHLAAWIGGADPTRTNEERYSQKHFDMICERYGGISNLDKYDTIFIDSITEAGRLCFKWCEKQPQSFSSKTGNMDLRGTYGLHSQEMIEWLKQLQQGRDKNVWLVGILNENIDDYNNRVFSLQIKGSKTGLELPGIVDQVITMTDIIGQDKELHRVFVCKTLNKNQFLAKDRSRKLNVYEKPHLGDLMKKINSPETVSNENLVYQNPSILEENSEEK